MKKKANKFVHPPFKIGWHHFSLTLPPEWEMTSYSTNPEQGALGFATEKGPCGQLTWRKVKAIPDQPRIMDEVHRRYLESKGNDEDKGFEKLNFMNCNLATAAWHKKGKRFYASAFLKESKMLIEWTFPEYSQRILTEITPMLHSFQENLKDANGNKFYGAFGIEINIPADFQIESVNALPASVSLEFVNKKHHRINAHRWGMPQLILQGETVEKFYHRFLYKNCRYAIKNTKELSTLDYEGAEVDFRTRGKFGFDFLLGPWWRGMGTAFYDKREERIYALEHIIRWRQKKFIRAEEAFGVKYNG